jgi:SPP1 family predicted phage head-tail adaptor
MFDTVAELGTPTEAPNDIGDNVKTFSWRTVDVSEKSISQTEFYQAEAVGKRPEIKLEMRILDYQNESTVRYDAGQGLKVYDVLRTFKKNRDFIELVLQGVSNTN